MPVGVHWPLLITFLHFLAPWGDFLGNGNGTLSSRGVHNSAVDRAPNEGIWSSDDGSSSTAIQAGQRLNDAEGNPIPGFSRYPSTHIVSPHIEDNMDTANSRPLGSYRSDSPTVPGASPNIPWTQRTRRQLNQQRLNNDPNRQKLGEKIRRKSKAAIKIATLNMRGRFDRDGQDKWLHINQIIRDNRIGVLALQETHLSSADNDKLNSLFLVIVSTIDPLHPGAKGTASVLNKRLINVNEVKQDVLIEGRALVLSVNWHADLTLRFLAIYAPNELSEMQSSLVL
ncbi:hypothetical protein DFH08DRAFT_827828 [Mycena albidolilacea]|uniref:Endonuclease/exonuclease/phosphatase domain-containing protein n=1 Tax=Mycena albidolilacea TaxID=1033008 RepID=A0AAD6YY64_9AGAR|nr:hypothetical protein DFH08DRAFT_827828 [Mycena albidolilacea]